MTAPTNYTPPVEVYYPSCVVNLLIRFDERFSLTREGAQAFSTEELLSRANSPQANIGNMLVLSGTSPDGLSHIAGRIPKKASVELPAYRQAGKFNLTFDFRDLPIDPRLVRSVGVRIYMDAIAAPNFAEGIGSPNASGERVSILPRTARPSVVVPSLDNLILAGFADTWHVSHTSSGSEVTIEGRDQRGVLLDSPVKPAMLSGIPLKSNIADVVQWIVDKHPLAGQVKINVVPDDSNQWPGGVIPSPTQQGRLTGSAQPRVRQGADGQQARASAGADPKNLNFWDLITRYCTLVGAVPYFYGDNELRIRPARSLYDQAAAGPRIKRRGDTRPVTPTPFDNGVPRDVGEPAPLVIRRMVFGHNVEDLSFERKFNGFTPRTIRVVSYDTSSKARGKSRLLEVRWPSREASVPGTNRPLATDPKKAGTSNAAPSGSVNNNDEMLISVPGISDKARLLQIAQDIYEELGRGEMGGSVKTRSLASFGGGNDDPDLIRLKPGDAVTITVNGRQLSNRAPLVSPLNQQAQSDDATLIREIAKRVGDVNLARVIVATSRNYVFELQNTFRVSNVKYDWSASNGVSIAFDFHNYVEARNGITPTTRIPVSRDEARRLNRSTGQNVPTRLPQRSR